MNVWRTIVIIAVLAAAIAVLASRMHRTPAAEAVRQDQPPATSATTHATGARPNAAE